MRECPHAVLARLHLERCPDETRSVEELTMYYRNLSARSPFAPAFAALQTQDALDQAQFTSRIATR